MRVCVCTSVKYISTVSGQCREIIGGDVERIGWGLLGKRGVLETAKNPSIL